MSRVVINMGSEKKDFLISQAKMAGKNMAQYSNFEGQKIINHARHEAVKIYQSVSKRDKRKTLQQA